jgi:hypothetical protein
MHIERILTYLESFIGRVTETAKIIQISINSND